MSQVVCDYSIVLDSPLGRLGVCLQAGHVTRLNYLPKTWRLRPPATQLEQGVAQQLQAYFTDSRFRFELPLEMHGTPFQLRVWQALQSIPVGTTVTYGQLAERLDSGARAVGNAVARNPVGFLIPCHRVIRKTGVLGHYGGGPARKKAMLGWESARVRNTPP